MMDEAGRGSTRPTPLFDNKGQEASVQSPLGDGPAISAVMFTAGVLGNLTALVLLLLARRRRLARRERLAPFHVLLMALVLTDLLGTCLLSPVVLAAYGRQRKLIELDRRVCDYFAFSMSFFSLATMSCLGAMALERSLAMAAPYLYERLLSGRPLALLLGALPALYGLAAAFCALPLMGFGSYVDYWPGTWCFIRMRSDGGTCAFALLYASVLLLLILAVLLGNLVVMVSLCRMYLRRAHTGLPGACRGGPTLGAQLRACRQPQSGGERAKGGARRPFSMSEELDHLILLFIMTIIFAVCSLPFTVSPGAVRAKLELEAAAWPLAGISCGEKQQEKKRVQQLFPIWCPSGTLGYIHFNHPGKDDWICGPAQLKTAGWRKRRHIHTETEFAFLFWLHIMTKGVQPLMTTVWGITHAMVTAALQKWCTVASFGKNFQLPSEDYR